MLKILPSFCSVIHWWSDIVGIEVDASLTSASRDVESLLFLWLGLFVLLSIAMRADFVGTLECLLRFRLIFRALHRVGNRIVLLVKAYVTKFASVNYPMSEHC